MSGADEQPESRFSYVSLEERVLHDHLLRRSVAWSITDLTMNSLVSLDSYGGNQAPARCP